MNPKYDVIVIGAGPAGSVAARRAAEGGLRTLLIEKRQEIGAPVRCAEAVGRETTRAFIDIDPRWVDAVIHSYAVHNARGDFVKMPPTETTLVLNRKVFDFDLARMAARAGAHVRTSTAAVGLVKEDQRVTGVVVEFMGRTERLQAGLVVAADGSESQAARWAGLSTSIPPSDHFVGVEFLLAGLKGRIDPSTCEYHLNREFSPGGYLWVFPKGEDTANVGLVVTPDQVKPAHAIEHLERFVAQRFSNTSILAVICGAIPAGGAIPSLACDGLVVVGDAAHQADPLTAGGINLGMIAADLAMQVAVPCLQAGEARAADLKRYEALWQERFGKEHKALHQIRKLIAKMSQDSLDGLVRDAAGLPIERMSLGQIARVLLKNHPGLLLQAGILAATGLIKG